MTVAKCHQASFSVPLARPGAKQTHAVRFYPVFCVERINPRAETAVSGAENPSLLEMLALLMVYLPSLTSKRIPPVSFAASFSSLAVQRRRTCCWRGSARHLKTEVSGSRGALVPVPPGTFHNSFQLTAAREG